jgi:cell division protease FtsH
MVELEKEGESNPYGFKPYSEATAAKIDEAVKKILDEAHAKALEIVKENKEKHRIIAEALLKYETLDEKQIMSLYKTGKMPEKDETEYPSESKASTYEEAKAAAEKREVEKAEKKDSDQALADQEKDALETPLEKNHEVEEHNPENPEKDEKTNSNNDSSADDEQR